MATEGVEVEFAPESLGGGATQHMMCVIPGGIYKCNDKDTHSMGLSGLMITTDKMSAETVYNLLKIGHANRKTLGSVHKIYKKWTPKSSIFLYKKTHY